MILSKAFEKFLEGSPVCVMIRGSLEYALPEQFVNELFENTAWRQYTRNLLFSDVEDLMGGVVCQVFPSVYAGYQKQCQRFSERGGTLVAIVQPEPTVLTSAVNTQFPTGVVAVNMFDGLVRYDEQLTPRPSLAEHWEVAADGRTITFHLRPGVRWHDGTDFTSADVKFSMEQVWQKCIHEAAPPSPPWRPSTPRMR